MSSKCFPSPALSIKGTTQVQKVYKVYKIPPIPADKIGNQREGKIVGQEAKECSFMVYWVIF